MRFPSAPSRVYLTGWILFLLALNGIAAQNRYKGQILEKTSGKQTDTMVLLLQYDLYYLGYGIFFEPYGGVTGVYNDATVRAVKAFQTDNGIIADGVFARKTAQAMESALQKSALGDNWSTFNPLRYKGKKLKRHNGAVKLSAEVARLQDDLTALGFPVDPSEKGVFGEQTEKALKNFQEEFLIPSSGILDDRTAITLAERLCLKASGAKKD